jgi:hypothetical protein
MLLAAYKPKSTIDKLVDFLNLLRGKTLISKEVNDLAREHNVRSNVHNFACELNLCVKRGKQYIFADYEFEPIHARQLIKLSNEYNVRVVEEARIRKEEKEKQLMNKAVELTETQDVFGEQIQLIPPVEPTPKNESMGLTDYFQNLFGSNKNIELKLLQEENNLLKKNNEDLLFEIRNLKAQISALELKNSLNNNLSNFDEEEIEMLRGKVEGFEKLFSFYFK